jgi:hypothetical protein
MAKKKNSLIGTPGYQAEGNILMTIGQCALKFQQAMDNRTAARNNKRRLFKEYTEDTGGYFDPDDHYGDEDYRETFEAIAHYKAMSKLIPGARAKMKRAIKVYNEYMDQRAAQRTNGERDAD